MLIVFPPPKDISDYHILAINIETIDQIITSKHMENNTFGLSVVKTFDGHQSNQSHTHFPLGVFKTSKDCLKLFQEIVDALKQDKKIFEIRSEHLLPLSNPPPNNKSAGIL